MILLENIDSNRAEWLKLRSKTIGSSDIPTILGHNPWKTPLALYREKRGEAQPVEVSEPMELGTTLEPLIGKFFSRRVAADGVMVAPSKCLYRHPSVEWATASPDFDLFKEQPDGTPDTGILETKYSHYRRASDWQDGKVPLYALIQHGWQMGVTGRKWGYIAGFVGDFFMSDKLLFDAETFGMMMEAAERFMHCVKTGQEPAAQAEDTKLVAAVDERIKGKMVELSEPEVAAIFRDYIEAKGKRTPLEEEAAEWEKIEKGAKARILQLMGNATQAQLTFNGTPYKLSATPVHVKEKVTPSYSFIRFSTKQAA
jgi:putative phage-type endonuclease